LDAGFSLREAEELTFDEVYLYLDALHFKHTLEDLTKQEHDISFSMMEAKSKRKAMRNINRERDLRRRKHHAIRPYDINASGDS